MREAVCSAWHELSICHGPGWKETLVNDPVLLRYVTCPWGDGRLHTDSFQCLGSTWVKAGYNQATLSSLNCWKILDSVTGWSFPSCRYKHILIFWLMEELTALCLDSSKISFFILLNTPYESVFICIPLPARQDTVTFPLFPLRCIFPLKGHGGWGIGAMLKMLHFISTVCFDNLFPSTFLNWMVINPLSGSPPSAQGVPPRSRHSSPDMEEITACHLFRGRVTLEDLCYLHFSSLKILTCCT